MVRIEARERFKVDLAVEGRGAGVGAAHRCRLVGAQPVTVLDGALNARVQLPGRKPVEARDLVNARNLSGLVLGARIVSAWGDAELASALGVLDRLLTRFFPAHMERAS